MRDVAIVGAGELGGAIAHVLARRASLRSILLVDESGRVAAGKALDIAQAAPVEGFATQMSGSVEIVAAAGADIVIIADRFKEGPWSAEEGRQLLEQLRQMAPRAVVVCAAASGADIVERGVRELGRDWRRLFGSAPEALAGAARALVALAANCSPRDVALAVLGRPPTQMIIPWQDATVGGFALATQLDEPARRRLVSRVAALWPPGPYALASAAAAVVEAMSGRSRRIVSCFVTPDSSASEAGAPPALRFKTSAMPVRLAEHGIDTLIQPSLSAVERVAWENAACYVP
jgi:malate dehydrogenase